MKATWLRAAAPVLAGIVLALHPTDPERAEQLVGVLPRWIGVHLGLLIALPLIALVIRHLVEDVPGRTARMASAMLVPAVAFYAAFESLVGTATGLLARHAMSLPAAEQAAAMRTVEWWWSVPMPLPVVAAVALTSWTAAVVCAGVALYRDAGRPSAGIALLVAAVAFLLGHPGITGAVSMAALTVAVLASPTSRVRAPVAA